MKVFLMNPLRKYSTHGWELELTLNNSWLKCSLLLLVIVADTRMMENPLQPETCRLGLRGLPAWPTLWGSGPDSGIHFVYHTGGLLLGWSIHTWNAAETEKWGVSPRGDIVYSLFVWCCSLTCNLNFRFLFLITVYCILENRITRSLRILVLL